MNSGIIKWGIFLISIASASSLVFGSIDDFFYEEHLISLQVSFWKIPQKPPEKLILYDVPFTSQAPLGDWKDPRQQNGCEEASALMAIGWARGEKNIIPFVALQEIRAMADFEFEHYGEFRDTSAEDTAKRILGGYFGYSAAEVKKNISAEDIKWELYQGRVVIVPVNGQKLGNKFFTPPGPLEHMVFIRGYDLETKEFVVNDPGTKHGEGFRYSSSVLEEALQDYPTGFHREIFKVEKVMVVVKKL